MSCYLYLLAVLFIGLSATLPAQRRLSVGEHFAPVNGAEIYYTVRGSGPVCLVPSPGWGPSVDYLANTLAPLEAYFTLVYYDTRLSGRSTGPPDPAFYTSRHLMEDMDSLRAYLEQPRVWLLGHSAGGFQVLNYGINHSNRLHGIIAITPLAGRDSLDIARYTQGVLGKQGREDFQTIGPIFLGQDTTPYKTSEWLHRTLPFFFHDPRYLDSIVQNIGTPLSDRAADNTRTSHFSEEILFGDLHRITVPTLVISGDDDFLSDYVSQSYRIVAAIPRANEVVIRDAGHFPWIEQANEFYERTFRWLELQGLQRLDHR